jgi:succinate dehydrogenase flavin-adding protein (antitoxin of CptAB toxin-antitoxin module)
MSEWRFDRYAYTQMQCDEIKSLLQCNDNDIVKVFSILWLKNQEAVHLLMLIQKVLKGESVHPESYMCQTFTPT